MALNTTASNFKGFTFDTYNSKNYGVYLTGAGVYNAPVRAVEMITIPGRNGSFALDQGRFENIEVTYHASIVADNETDFANGIANFRNAICSKVGYQRLEDEYNPDEYRMAVYKSGLDVTPKMLRTGEFDIVFDCKPQRFLKSGEDEMIFDKMGKFIWRHDDNESEPYLFRKTAGTVQEVGNAIYDELVGGSVGFNQLYSIPATDKSTVKNDVTITDNRDGSYTLSGTASSTTYYTIIGQFQNYLVSGHKYIILGMNGGNVYFNDSYWGRFDTTKNTVILYSNPDNQRTEAGFKIINGATVNETVKPQIIDLTLLFGSTIADYIYSLEQNTAGAGVNWFKKYFPNDYYPYNAGELLSVNATEHKTVGFNQLPVTPQYTASAISFDATKCTRLIKGQSYQYTFASMTGATSWRTLFTIFDLDGNKIDPNDLSLTIVTAGVFSACDKTLYWNGSFKAFIQGVNNTDKAITFTPAMDCYLHIAFSIGDTSASTVMNSPCVHLRWDGSRDSEYEPYSAHEYALDSDLTLRGIPTLDNGKLKYDGDVYKSDGTVTRKYKSVTIDGSNAFVYQYNGTTSAGPVACMIVFSDKAYGMDNIVSDKFIVKNADEVYAMLGRTTNGGVQFLLPSTVTASNAGCKAWFTSNPTTVVYELATPTTESADPYDNPQVISEYGTEEYISNNIVPVGHVTDHAYFEDSIIVNPTLFPAKPLLEVVGFGDIELNQDTMSIYQADLGLITLNRTFTRFQGINYYVDFDTDNINSGDDVYLYNILFHLGIEATNGITVWDRTAKTGDAVVWGTRDSSNQITIRIKLDPFSFKYGTSKTSTTTATYYVQTNGVNKYFDMTVSVLYNGTNRVTVSETIDIHTWSNSDGSYGYGFENPGRIEANSTKPAVDNTPIYIDLDIGEAYKVSNDTMVSVDNLVSIPAELPELNSGNNDIDFDNTITSVKVTPRWWKV